ncbi:unnamed protein product [Discosporangium mesarthrocarpum]
MGHMAMPMLPKNTNVRPVTCGTPLTGGEGVSLRLIKRGNKGKVEAQQVLVPSDTSLGAQVHRNEEASRVENDIIKARVLAYEATIEAEEQGRLPQEGYQNLIPQVHNAPLTSEDLKGRARNTGGSGGRDEGRGKRGGGGGRRKV